MSRAVSVGLSIDLELVEKVDHLRGDVPRSRYIARLIEKGIDAQKGTE